MRINKTKSSLNITWQLLDDACGDLDNAIFSLQHMTGLSEEIVNTMNSIDISAIVALKNYIEEFRDK